MARAIDGDALYQKFEAMGWYDNADRDLAEDILLGMPTLTLSNEWVSVDERLPEYNPGTGAKSYWVAKKDNAGNWQMKIAQYCDYGYAMTMDAETEVTWRDWDFTKIANVTHWMPLPAPPDKDNNVLAKTPNEPLTLEQLREMDGEPVWVTPLGFWALVIAKHDERVKLISNDGEIVYADKEIELVGPVYRRPPEGEA